MSPINVASRGGIGDSFTAAAVAASSSRSILEAPVMRSDALDSPCRERTEDTAVEEVDDVDDDAEELNERAELIAR